MNLFYRLGILPSVLLLLGILGSPANADDLLVTNLNDSGEGSLRDAVANASDGDTINISPNLLPLGDHTTVEIKLTSGPIASPRI